MCGIYAQVGRDNVIENTVNGLCRLEYRGYDSFGIAFFGSTEKVVKGLGSISSQDLSSLSGDYLVSLGHTRWATHGEVSIKNAHPQISYNDRVYVVHNGIYENAKACGGTDTLAIANLLATAIHYEDKPNEQEKICVWRKVIETIKGDNAVVFYYKALPGRLFYFVTGNGVLYKSGNRLTSEVLDNEPHEKVRQGLYCLTEAPSFSLAHHVENKTMMDEIVEQVEIFRNYDFVDTGPFYENNRYTDVIACGSSLIASSFAKYLLDINVYNAAEYRYFKPNGNRSILVSQSGETADLVALERLESILITNSPNSTLASRYTVIPLNVGKEQAVAATKTFTKTCARFAEILSPDVVSTGAFADIIEQLIGVDYSMFSDTLSARKNALILGTLFDFPIAQEGALKFKEVSGIHAEAMISAEMKHGPIALIDKDMPCLFIITHQQNPTLVNRTISNMREVESRGGQVLVIAEEGISVEYPTIVVPRLNHKPEYARNYFQSLTCVIPLQILSYQIALNKGLNPNRPRNLAKCVTV